LERRVQQWKLQQDVQREVTFPQTHHPGDVLAFDFVVLNGLGVTLGGRPFDQELSALLASAVTDSYVRTRAKAARYRPSKPDKKPTGAPKVRKMTAQEKRQAKEFERKLAA
jgi:hypothetical protein